VFADATSGTAELFRLQSSPESLLAIPIASVLHLRTPSDQTDEIRMLHWSQIDFEKRTVMVGRAKTQAGTGRVIPLNQPAFEALAKWAGRLVEAKPEDYVFPACEAAGIERDHPDKERIDPSKPITSWRSAWRAALKRAELQIRFHDLRHTCITKLAESQASEHTLMAIACHVSRKMIEHYSHIRMAAKRAALDAIVNPGSQSVSEGSVAQNWAQSSNDEKPAIRN
jgi:integrase